MYNLCINCGEYDADKLVEKRDRGHVAICRLCQHAHPFIRQPLLITCGASAVGKTTTTAMLTTRLANQVVTMEGDILYSGQAIEPYADIWLRVCMNIGQCGRPVLLSANGLIPQNVELRIGRRYFSTVHYLAFTCERGEQIRRLKRRPSWRHDSAQSNPQVDFNRWIREESGLELLDTTHISAAESADYVEAWVQRCLSPQGANARSSSQSTRG